MRDVSRFLPGYNGIVQTFAMGITWECGSLPIRDTLCCIVIYYITYIIVTLKYCILLNILGMSRFGNQKVMIPGKLNIASYLHNFVDCFFVFYGREVCE